MKRELRRKLVIALLALSFVLAIGSAVYAAQDCPARWGEPIGINCEVSFDKVTASVKEIVTDEGIRPECETRWGEPVGTGCSVPYTVAVVESGDLQSAGELYTNCPTRWGEPVGVNCMTSTGH